LRNGSDRPMDREGLVNQLLDEVELVHTQFLLSLIGIWAEIVHMEARYIN